MHENYFKNSLRSSVICTYQFFQPPISLSLPRTITVLYHYHYHSLPLSPLSECHCTRLRIRQLDCEQNEPITSQPSGCLDLLELRNEGATSQPPLERNGPIFLARQSLQIVFRLLCKRVPLEIALEIIRAADTHPCSMLASRKKAEYEVFSVAGGKKTYLTAQIPYFENVRDLRTFK